MAPRRSTTSRCCSSPTRDLRFTTSSLDPQSSSAAVPRLFLIVLGALLEGNEIAFVVLLDPRRRVRRNGHSGAFMHAFAIVLRCHGSYPGALFIRETNAGAWREFRGTGTDALLFLKG